MGSSKELKPDDEILLESDTGIDNMGDLDDLEIDDNDELSLDDESSTGQVLQSTSKRV